MALELRGGWWNPFTKGLQRGKPFHVMTKGHPIQLQRRSIPKSVFVSQSPTIWYIEILIPRKLLSWDSDSPWQTPSPQTMACAISFFQPLLSNMLLIGNKLWQNSFWPFLCLSDNSLHSTFLFPVYLFCRSNKICCQQTKDSAWNRIYTYCSNTIFFIYCLVW